MGRGGGKRKGKKEKRTFELELEGLNTGILVRHDRDLSGRIQMRHSMNDFDQMLHL